ncbi:SRPBCC domain-containing protein [Candidatus Gottesmanbacteria bacterium]|nr:SRPBCC domain-containing protein [Candidatus Gottesmanbacteria bacterium]
MKTIKQIYTINASPEKVWNALVDPKTINEWGGGPANMDEKLGTKFTLWRGDIHGKNIEVVQNKKIVQEWFGGDWEKPSKVTFTLTKKGETTELSLLHEDIPDNSAKDIDDGWKTYYLGPLKALLEHYE